MIHHVCIYEMIHFFTQKVRNDPFSPLSLTQMLRTLYALTNEASAILVLLTSWKNLVLSVIRVMQVEDAL
jgi:hypothetical protein